MEINTSNIWDAAEGVFKNKFIDLNICIRKR